MLRFIIERHQQDQNQGSDWYTHCTIDADVPELEQALTRVWLAEAIRLDTQGSNA